MSYLRHPPLLAGVSLLLVLVGLYFVGGSPSTADTALYYEKNYVESTFQQVQAIEQYDNELAPWCAQKVVDDRAQLDSWAKSSAYTPLWIRYYDALRNCSTSDDHNRSSAFLIESIYSLTAAYR